MFTRENLMIEGLLKPDNRFDVQRSCDYLYATLIDVLDRFYPERSITVTSRDPQYVTPDLKALLRRKNRLMRSGKTEQASVIAKRIGAFIWRRNSVHLRNWSLRTDSKEKWAKVKQLTKGPNRQSTAPPGMTAESLNQHYTSISIDNTYKTTKVKESCLAPRIHITEWEVFNLLDRLKPTATGLDNIPAWFLRITAPVFAGPITELYKQSIDSGVVPTQWKKLPSPLFQRHRIPQHQQTTDLSQ
jgi:hypothetical protein